MSEWKEYKLGEIADVQTGPFGSQLHQSDYVDVGIPSIMPVNIGDRMNISTEKIVYITEEDAVRLSRYRTQKGDIVYSRRGDVEKCAYINEDEAGWLCGTGCLRIRIDSAHADPKFVAYYLSTEDMKSWISNNAVGTTMPNLNSSILQQVPLSLPSLEEQKQIASILSSLDDKIDLLNRENATLEAMAETLFRQWFIEEAKEDWEEKPLSSYGKIICGKTPPKNESKYFGGSIPFIKISDMHGSIFVFNSEDSLTEEGKMYQNEKTLPPGSIIVSCIATVGLVVMNAKESQTNQQINSIIPYKEEYRFFLFHHLKNMYDELNAMASGGTATLNLNTKNFSNIHIACPSMELLDKFDEQVKLLYSKIFSNQKQIIALAKQRKELLPKLMSNEIQL